jgi:hypothetical protein
MSVPAPTPRHVLEGGKWVIPMDSLRVDKREEINAAHAAHVRGSTPVSLGFSMQFDTRDAMMVRGAIELAQAMGQSSIYLTDSENVNHVDVPIADAQTVLMEMMAAFATAHAKKQALRGAIDAATTPAELDAIGWDNA